jgi:hypothetical protein
MTEVEMGPGPVDKPAPEADSAAAGAKSRGQELLDRFLAVAKKIDGGARELDGLRTWIDGPKPGPTQLQAVEESATAKPTPTSFFEGLERIAGFLEKVAERQDKAVAGIKGLF